MKFSFNSHRAIAIFLAISYGIGGPFSAFLEYKDNFFSEKFDLPKELLYLCFTIQFICAIGVLIQSLARWSAFCLTVTTIGAIYAHFSIGSPITSIVAFIFSGLQIWFGLKSD